MTDTWTTRELPVLRVIADSCDDPHGRGDLLVKDVVARTGLPEDDVLRALTALASADPPYIEGVMVSEARYPVRISDITERARRAIGAWPSDISIVDSLIAAFNAVADKEPDAKKRSRLRETAAWLGGAGRDLGVEVGAALIARQIGSG